VAGRGLGFMLARYVALNLAGAIFLGLLDFRSGEVEAADAAIVDVVSSVFFGVGLVLFLLPVSDMTYIRYGTIKEITKTSIN
jgi:hypothetical protein